MAISTRELYIIFRARDEASRVVKAFARNLDGASEQVVAEQKKHMKDLQRGASLIGVGTGIAAAGAAATAFFVDATKAAITYNQAAAKTLTQVDGMEVSLERIKDIGRTVASVVPVPFEETQSSLYDIFSSMEVTVEDAEHLLTEFSKAAVGGQVSLQDAARATIGILNAYKIPATEVNKVNDIMFQLVRKGVGTYGDFATTIGRSVPSAVRAGQSFEDLAGMMAFLTRNGLTAANATASAGRALDAMSHPRTIGRLEQFGETVREAVGDEVAEKLGIAEDAMIKVTDASGKFRPVSAIMTDLGTAVKGMSAKQISAVMQAILKGSGGTIQARRFFDVAIRNFAELNNLTKDMHRSSGALKGAYDIMFRQPQSQIQLLKNQIAILRTEIGDALIPVAMALIKVGSALFNWFNKLPKPVKTGIIIIAAITTVLITLTGVVVAIAGAFLVFNAAMALVGPALGGIAATVGIVIGIIVAVAIIVFLIVKYHKQIWAFIQKIWKIIVDFLERVWDNIYETVQSALKSVWDFITKTFNSIVNFFVGAWNTIFEIVSSTLSSIWGAITGVFNAVWNFIKALWGTTVVQFFVAVFTTLFTIWKEFWLTVLTIIYTAIGLMVQFIMTAWTTITGWLKAAWDIIVSIAKAAWNLLKTTISNAVTAVVNFVRNAWAVFVDWITDRWNTLAALASRVWNTIKNNIITPISSAITAVKNTYIAPLVDWLADRWEDIKTAVKEAWELVKKYIVDPIANAAAAIKGWIDTIIGYMNGFKETISNIAEGIRDVLNKINPLNKDSPSLVDRTMKGFSALKRVVKSGLTDIDRMVGDRTFDIRGNMTDIARSTGTMRFASVGPGGGGTTNNTPITINTQEINPMHHAAMLGLELGRR